MRGAGFLALLILSLAAVTLGVPVDTPLGAPAAHAAQPDPAYSCTTVAAWARDVHARSANVSILVLADISGVAAQRVVARVNDIRLRTGLAADRVIVVGAHELKTETPVPYLVVAFFNSGCLVTSGRADPTSVAHMLGGEAI